MLSKTEIKTRCKTIRALWSTYLGSAGVKKDKITQELRDICRELYSVKIGTQSCDSGYNDSCQDIVNKMKKHDPDAYLYIEESDEPKRRCNVM